VHQPHSVQALVGLSELLTISEIPKKLPKLSQNSPKKLNLYILNKLNIEKMSERTNKRRKLEGGASRPKDRTSTILDPRFSNIQSDPRYRLPSKKHRIKLDSRFSRALKDDDFTRRAKVDRYGRPLRADAEREKLKRKYDFEEDEYSDEADDDDEVQKELKAADASRDILREGKYSDSSSSSSSDEDSDSDLSDADEAELAPTTQSNVPTGEVSSRLAVVNLDWDNIRAQDLMAVFSSFLSDTGKLTHVAIYASEFGKERLAREELEGPPPEIFSKAKSNDEEDAEMSSASYSDENDEAIKSTLLKPSDPTDFDPQALRTYQLQRLRYFYAILTFSSASTAKHIYDAVDGTEYLSTANFFDLRFVPDETDFSADQPREECSFAPADYKPNSFVTDALQHSKVRLTWDAEDSTRKEAQARAFRGGRREIDENDLKAYLGSDSSDSESEAEAAADEQTMDEGTTVKNKKDSSRAKMRALLGLAPEPEAHTKHKDKAPVGNVQITFSAGLSGAEKGSVFTNTEQEANETTVEKYVRKEKERKQRRKEKARASRGVASAADSDDEAAGGAVTADTAADQVNAEDLGFDDPFFAEEVDTTSTPKSANKTRKEERLKKRREREIEEKNDAKERKKLEKVMAEDGEKDMRHFDMKDVLAQEKAERKAEKGKKQKKKERKRDVQKRSEADEFAVNTTDPRFAGRLFGNHEFAIDPLNPRYTGSKGMERLLAEGRKRKDEKGQKDGNVRDGTSDAAGDDVRGLVEKLKNKGNGKKI
jgi:hypothetical protein